jgi:hypothetical protein
MNKLLIILVLHLFSYTNIHADEFHFKHSCPKISGDVASGEHMHRQGFGTCPAARCATSAT